MTHALTFARAKERLTREEGAHSREQKSEHISVLKGEVLEALAIKSTDLVVDATSGMGGHGEAILAHSKAKLIAFDADPASALASRKRLKRFSARAAVINANFRDLGTTLKREGVREVNKFLFDLGWNRTQLNSGKGFSFMEDEPLNMSYGDTPASGFTAAEILNSWSEEGIADALYGYGEERYAKRIAKAIVIRREIAPIKSTFELVEIIRDAVPAGYRRGRLHPATKTFQALRVAVNDELRSLEKGLTSAWELLAREGRIAVITFHSIEDRMVKRFFAARVKEGGRLVYKKPLSPTRHEILTNPSSRSAKLRAIEKI